jgi:hypothetical protein
MHVSDLQKVTYFIFQRKIFLISGRGPWVLNTPVTLRWQVTVRITPPSEGGMCKVPWKSSVWCSFAKPLFPREEFHLRFLYFSGSVIAVRCSVHSKASAFTPSLLGTWKEMRAFHCSLLRHYWHWWDILIHFSDTFRQSTTINNLLICFSYCLCTCRIYL